MTFIMRQGVSERGSAPGIRRRAFDQLNALNDPLSIQHQQRHLLEITGRLASVACSRLPSPRLNAVRRRFG
ncbi:Uncharacterised protein [Kluyvera cryocrescens]|uniref:Uncharacterized protein n=1 Tax=Kluyvera cryocrescens TaxID=580 RepID=A0A485A635_KLUCR|nr:Uncharacterised protein [Kluyvera cryocrescens]